MLTAQVLKTSAGTAGIADLVIRRTDASPVYVPGGLLSNAPLASPIQFRTAAKLWGSGHFCLFFAGFFTLTDACWRDAFCRTPS